VGTNAKRILSRLIFLYYNPLQTAETFKKTKKKYIVNQRQCYSEKKLFPTKITLKKKIILKKMIFNRN